MSTDVPDRARRALERHDGFTPAPPGYDVETTVFDATVTAEEGDDGESYTVRVTVPEIDAVTADPVGSAVRTGWFETLKRRLAEAPKATRSDVDLAAFRLSDEGDDLVVTYRFVWPDADRAVAIAKTFVEYVEGTYVESVIPGYEYGAPVSDLLSEASSRAGDESSGPTPL